MDFHVVKGSRPLVAAALSAAEAARGYFNARVVASGGGQLRTQPPSIRKLVDFCLREYVRRIFEQYGRRAKPQTSGGEPFTGEALEIWRAAEAKMREAQSCVVAYDQDQRLGVPRKFVYSSHWEGTGLREVGKVVDSTIEGCVKKVASTSFGHDAHSINIWAYDDAEESKHVVSIIQYPHRGWD